MIKLLVFFCLAFAWIPSLSALSQAESAMINLGLASTSYRLSEQWLAFTVGEADQGIDFNGDGDIVDHVIHLRHLGTGVTTNLGLASSVFELTQRWLAFDVGEADQGMDLNGDGDMQDRVLHVHRLATGETTNLGLASFAFEATDQWLTFHVRESDQGVDLNGDGDIERGEAVIYVHHLDTGETTNLALASVHFLSQLSDRWLTFQVSESGQGLDLNGDGDMEDRVLHVYQLDTGITTNLGMASSSFRLSGQWLAFDVGESDQGMDLNGDGDRSDRVLHVHQLNTGVTSNLGVASFVYGFSDRLLGFQMRESDQGVDLNDDGDLEDTVLHARHLESGMTVNLGLAGTFERSKWLAFQVRESDQGEDFDGDGKVDGKVIHILDSETGEITNLGLASFLFQLSKPQLAFDVRESGKGQDFNGDGDMDDRVLHVFNLDTEQTTNLKLASLVFEPSNQWLAFEVRESDQGADLNGDGDTDDHVLHLRHLESGEVINLELSAATDGIEHTQTISNEWFAFAVTEAGQDSDLNGDGDLNDLVLHVVDLVQLESLMQVQ